MKEFAISTDSWHFRLAKLGGFDTRYHNRDICTYTQKMVRALFIGSMLGLLIAFIGYFFFECLFGLIFSAIAGMWITTIQGEIVLLILGVGVAFVILCCICMFTDDGIARLRARKRNCQSDGDYQPGFVTTIYKSWKDKFCIRLKFMAPIHYND